jgi:hypothetical protein
MLLKVSVEKVSKLIKLAPFIIAIISPIEVIFAVANTPAVDSINNCPLFKCILLIYLLSFVYNLYLLIHYLNLLFLQIYY